VVGLLRASRSSSIGREGRLLQDLIARLIYITALFAKVTQVLNPPIRGLPLTSGVIAIILGAIVAIVQYGGLCWTPCVGKAAVQKEIERRVAAKNHVKIIGKYVSGNVAVVKTEVRITSIDKSGAERPAEWSPGVDRIIVWNIYELAGDKVGVVTLVGQRTDPQTARFIAWLRSWQGPPK
jgi:hypothetical protein